MIQKEIHNSLPLLSIVITFFNEGILLARAVRSCRALGVENIEIIIINDGSPDDPLEILKADGSDLTNVRIHAHENQGVSKSRNVGLDISRGYYITYLDADDSFEVSDLTLVLPTEHNVVRLASITEDLDGQSFLSRELPFSSNGAAYIAFSLINESFRDTCWGYIYNRDWLLAARIRFRSELIPHEDIMFIIEALLCADKVLSSPIVFYRYTRRVNSATSNLDKQKIRERLMAMSMLLSDLVSLNKVIPEARLELFIDKYWSYMSQVSMRTHSRRCRLIALRAQMGLILEHYAPKQDAQILRKELSKAYHQFRAIVWNGYRLEGND